MSVSNSILLAWGLLALGVVLLVAFVLWDLSGDPLCPWLWRAMRPLAFILCWCLYVAGDCASRLLNLFPRWEGWWVWMYRAYNGGMLRSHQIQSWAGGLGGPFGPWPWEPVTTDEVPDDVL